MSNTRVRVDDRVREIETGDEGFVLGDVDGTVRMYEDNICVRWVTGEQNGCTLHIGLDKIEIVRSHISSVEEALNVLTNAGFVVTLTRKS